MTRVIYFQDADYILEACREVAPGFVVASEVYIDSHEDVYDRLLPQYKNLDELVQRLEDVGTDYWDTAAEPLQKWEDMPESRYCRAYISTVDDCRHECNCTMEALLQKGCGCGGA